MSLPADPYDKTRVINALVNHAWTEKKDHKPAFQAMGINSKEELRDVISRCIEGSDTRAFKTQPVADKKQTLPREVYELPLQGASGSKMVVVLNPGRDLKTGQLLGGTAYVPGDKNGTFDEVFKREQAVNDQTTGYKLSMAIGGRPALRERETRQQVSTEIKGQNVAVNIPDKGSPEKLQFKRETPREQEKGPSQEKPKAPEKAHEPQKLVFKRDTDRDHSRGR